MEKNINQKILTEDPSAETLIRLLEEHEHELSLEDAYISHNFPFYADIEESAISANILLISKHYGVIIFQCISQRGLNGGVISSAREKVEHIYSLIFSKLIKSKVLRAKVNELNTNVSASIFIPNASITDDYQKSVGEDFLITTDYQEIKNFLLSNRTTQQSDNKLRKEILAILEGSKGIIKPKIRKITEEDKVTKGSVLNKVEAEIANFDNEQRSAALFIIDGFQRIRGLAGSGKTIVLAMKAAQIHLQDPNAVILYTFHTKSLYEFIKRLITRFYRQFAEQDPNWEKIKILHAWGGKSLEGVYYNACLVNNIRPTSFTEAQNLASTDRNAFNKVCELLINNPLSKMYDYSILDEAQDFPVNFYRLCQILTKNNRIIWGFDECQNIFDIELQDEKKTFGKDENGQYLCDFSQEVDYQDIVLHNCYRNPNKILVCAFALGLGIYGERIIQMLENNAHWGDLGFEVLEGHSRKGDKMVITRLPGLNLQAKERALEEWGDNLNVQVLDSVNEECEFIVNSIEKDIQEDLLPEDILVICLDDRIARGFFKLIGNGLNRKKINFFNLLDSPAFNKDFCLEGHVTLTTVYRAKGNEAASVYIAGVDGVFQNKNSIVERNKIFTAITRAKAWATITGVGKFAQECHKEVELMAKNYPKLEFTMPDSKALKVFQRGLEEKQRQFNELRKTIDDFALKTGMDKQLIIDELFKENKKKALRKNE